MDVDNCLLSLEIGRMKYEAGDLFIISIDGDDVLPNDAAVFNHSLPWAVRVHFRFDLSGADNIPPGLVV